MRGNACGLPEFPIWKIEKDDEINSKKKKILYATKCNCLHSFEYLDFNYIVFFRLKRNKKKNLTLQMVVAFVSISDVVILIVICCCCCMHA